MKIVVLAGGISTERAVSLVTGTGVCRALRENGHRAILVDLFLGLEEVPADLAGVDAVVFGHSHKYVQEEKDGVLWLNPGSCGPRRFHQEITMMMAEVENGTLRGEKVTIPHEAAWWSWA